MKWDRQHVISVEQFDGEDLRRIFLMAKGMEAILNVCRIVREVPGGLLSPSYVMCTLFCEPSTRTRVSFEMAMRRLGGSVISTSDARAQSSIAKGESLADTIKTLTELSADVIVLRTSDSGMAERATECTNVPIINAGDGTNEHPTQALLDVYTIQQELDRIDGITVGLLGDLKNGRTVHSLTKLLALFNDVKVILISPDGLGMPSEVLEYLDQRHVSYSVTDDLRGSVEDLDVLYVTRLQRERFGSPEEAQRHEGTSAVDTGLVRMMKHNSCILHPLPRVNELTPNIDLDPRAAYFRQVRNGLCVRMALLKMILTE